MLLCTFGYNSVGDLTRNDEVWRKNTSKYKLIQKHYPPPYCTGTIRPDQLICFLLTTIYIYKLLKHFPQTIVEWNKGQNAELKASFTFHQIIPKITQTHTLRLRLRNLYFTWITYSTTCWFSIWSKQKNKKQKNNNIEWHTIIYKTNS